MQSLRSYRERCKEGESYAYRRRPMQLNTCNNRNQRFASEGIKFTAVRRTGSQYRPWLPLRYSAELSRSTNNPSSRIRQALGDVSRSTSSVENITKRLLSYMSAENKDISLASDSSLSGLLSKQGFPATSYPSKEGALSEEDRQLAARKASLLASEAVLESARQRAMERRNMKLVQLRARMQVRHEQVEARKRELEAAQRMRIFDLLERHSNGLIKRTDLLAHGLQGYHAKLSKLRSSEWQHLPNANQNRNTQNRRPVIAFGSTTPRLACLTTREMQSVVSCNGNNTGAGLLSSKVRASTNTSASIHHDEQWQGRPTKSLDRKLLSMSAPRKDALATRSRRIENKSRVTQSLIEESCSESTSEITRSRMSRSLYASSAHTVGKGIQDRNTSSGINTESNKSLRSSSQSTSRQRIVSSTSLARTQQASVTHTRLKLKRDSLRETTSAKLPKMHNSDRPSGLSSTMTKSETYATSTKDTVRKETSLAKKKPLSATLKSLQQKEVPQQVTASSCGDMEEAYRRKMRIQREKARQRIMAEEEKRLTVEATQEALEELACMLVEEIWQSSVKTIGERAMQSMERLDQSSGAAAITVRNIPSNKYEETEICQVHSTVEGKPNTQVNTENLNANESAAIPKLVPSAPKPHLTDASEQLATVFSQQEIAEREERKRRLELVMSRLKNVRRATDHMRANLKCAESMQSLSPTALDQKSEMLSQSQRASPTYSALNLADEHQLLIRPNSSAFVALTPRPITHESLDTLSSAGQTAITDTKDTRLARSDAPLPPSTSRSSSSNRANVLASLLASGRLAATSRAASVLLNMSSDRTPTEGMPSEESGTTPNIEVKDIQLKNTEED